MSQQPRKERTVRKYYEPYRLVTTVEGDSMVDRQFGNDTNINKIIARFKRGNYEDMPEQGQQCFQDVSGMQKDLADIMTDGKKALNEFERLKAKHDREATRRFDEAEKKERAEFEAWKANQRDNVDNQQNPE